MTKTFYYTVQSEGMLDFIKDIEVLTKNQVPFSVIPDKGIDDLIAGSWICLQITE